MDIFCIIYVLFKIVQQSIRTDANIKQAHDVNSVNIIHILYVLFKVVQWNTSANVGVKQSPAIMKRFNTNFLTVRFVK